MDKIRQIVLLLVLQIVWLQPVLASDAWWVLCDSCETHTDYRNAVLAAPGGDRIYFVSNANTLDTRKYEQYSTYEDFSDGVVEMTWVTDLELSPSEEAAFASLLESANTIFTVVDAGALDGGSTSIADHISSGRLSSSLLNTLRMEMYIRGMFPSNEEATEAAGTGLGTIWKRELSRTTNSARQKALVILVKYPDGSEFEIALSPDGVTWTDLEARDSEGRILPVYGPDASGYAPVDSAGFYGMNFSFGSGSGFDDLFNWLTGNQGLECDVNTYPDRMVVTCRRPD